MHTMEGIVMKTLASAMFALVLSAPFTLADGCNKHDDVAMSCATGQTWDADAKQCLDTGA
jgi:hypothetical protein